MAPKKERKDSSSSEEETFVDLIATDGCHSFLYFGDIKPVSLKKSIKSRFKRLKNKAIMPGKVLDWHALEYLGQKKTMQNILTRRVELHGDNVFYCKAWENVMTIREDIYIELCREFFASFSINKTITDYYDEGMLTFRLGGGSMKSMSLADFAVAIGIYTRAQIESPMFDQYMAVCEREQSDDFNSEEAWIELGIGKYQASLTKSILIKDPYLRLIHRMITYSINGRGNGHERISRRDLWLLYQVSDPSRYTDIPYSLALFLQETGGLRDNSSICGGQYVTKLAKYFGILSHRVCASLTPTNEMGWINLSDMRRMWVAHYSDASRSTTVWGDDRDLYNEEDLHDVQIWEDDRNIYSEEALPLPPQSRPNKRLKSEETELDYEVNYTDLNLRIIKLQESIDIIQEMQRRCMYDLYRTMQQLGLDNQMVTTWYDPTVPSIHVPPYGQLPRWDPQHQNPPHSTPYDQWIRRPDGN